MWRKGFGVVSLKVLRKKKHLQSDISDSLETNEVM